MHEKLTRGLLAKLRQKLRRARVASWLAIEKGDYHAVARLTCETARLKNAISITERTVA
jgi:hypothetical protein